MAKYIGTRKYVTGTEMREAYEELAAKNEKAALLLEKNGLYQESVYMYIQTMEKKIKACLCEKIDATNPYFSDKLREVGHSLDLSIDFLIEIIAGNNEALKEQLSYQSKIEVFQNIRFSRLHNECRYPLYNQKKNDYSVLSIDKEGCQRVAGMNVTLDKFIGEYAREDKKRGGIFPPPFF